jgi:AraC family transcriptional regulator
MFLRTEITKEKKLIGMRKRMSFVKYTVFELWRNFMPRRNEIKNINADYISLDIYNDVNFFSPFNPAYEFEKWATVEVANYDSVPEGMETLTVPSSLYAVFLHKGTSEDAQKTYR